jgi:hypothetical protein
VQLSRVPRKGVRDSDTFSDRNVDSETAVVGKSRAEIKTIEAVRRPGLARRDRIQYNHLGARWVYRMCQEVESVTEDSLIGRERGIWKIST